MITVLMVICGYFGVGLLYWLGVDNVIKVFVENAFISDESMDGANGTNVSKEKTRLLGAIVGDVIMTVTVFFWPLAGLLELYIRYKQHLNKL